MIHELRLNNFRAFKAESISLKKLNIFVGPNNSGKSSVLSAINLIAQNVKSTSRDYTLSLNGPFADLGTYHDTVHGHDASSQISIGFDIGTFSYDYKYRYRPQKREIELVRYSVSDSKYSYRYVPSGSGLEGNVFLKSMNGSFRDVQFRSKPEVNGFLVSARSILHSRKSIRHVIGPDEGLEVFEFLYDSQSNLDRSLSSFESVGAFRISPQRVYQYTGDSPSTVGRFGENSVMLLASSASSRAEKKSFLLKNVSEWFRSSGIANNISISSLTNRHFEVNVEDRAGYNSNIVDAGSGCSQVIPVLTAGYNLISNSKLFSQSILVLQEPEIHLHPSAAAHLGSFFVDLVKSKIQCFVETHSENVIIRVAQHIAQGDLTPDDVAIYWVSANTGNHVITKIDIRKDGTFMDQWPDGFFPTRTEETAQLARAAMRAQQRMGTDK